MKVVVNSSPLIALGSIAQVHLLKSIYEEVYLPDEVFRETVTNGKNAIIGDSIRNYGFRVKSVSNIFTVNILSEIVDRGEAEVIVLAGEIGASTVIIDEIRARRIAEKQNLDVIGSIGILLIAKKRKLIPSLSECITQMQQQNIYISDKLKTEVLKEAGEAF